MNIAAPETMPSTTALSEPHTGTAAIPSSAVSDRASRLYSRMLSSVQYRTHRMFAVILILQWLGGIGEAFWLSPLPWLGASSRIHLHVWLFLGGAITVVPIILSILRPAASVTRHVVCISQALWSALLIHLLGGRMETHFHVFGSLALIACYRDWRVLASASAVVVIDHLARGIYFPMSVYGTQTAASWRTLEHAAWVVFTNIFLLISLKQQHEHMQALAIRHAELEKSYQDVEETVEDRTRQLTHLQQENSRYSAFIESCEHAIVGTRPDGTIYSWNPGAEELYGYTADEAIGKSVCMLVPSPLQAELADIHNEVRSGTPVLNVETQRLRRNGTLCDISLSVWPSFDDSGQPVGCVSVARDITRHREMERAIELSEKRLDRAVRATSDGPWEWNIETHEVWCTPRFFELLGYADREIEMSFAEWESRLHPDDYAAVFEALQRSIDHGELLDVEYRLLTKSDDWKWLRARGACEHNSDGQAVRMAGSIQDIDQQKSQESLLAAQEETLQRRQKLEAVGSLAGGIAHEFNNLLQAIPSSPSPVWMKKTSGSRTWPRC